MSLKITNIQKQGTENSEYILLKAESDLNLSDFAVVDRTYKDGKVSNIHKHYFRFPSYSLKSGQYVALFTGKGTDKDGTTSEKHFCKYVYWGFEKPILNDVEIESIQVLKIQVVDSRNVK